MPHVSSDPVLHLVCGPNGAGKSTLVSELLVPATHLPFINADVLAAANWPDDPETHSYEAAQLAERFRRRAMRARGSFITETVFSHPSKLALVRDAIGLGYRVTLHVVIVPEDLAVARVADRVRRGGHTVPETKARERFRRLWPLVADACILVQKVRVYDNSSGQGLKLIARFEQGVVVSAQWPSWAPSELRALNG
jgi:predicted ABC-type ATPase